MEGFRWRMLFWPVVVMLLLIALIAFAAPADAYEGVSPEITYCFEDRKGNFYGLWAYAPTTSGQMLISGHTHNEAFQQDAFCWIQPFYGSGYGVIDQETGGLSLATVGLTVVGDGVYCPSGHLRLVFDYTQDPWEARGYLYGDGFHKYVSLTRVDCSHHPEGMPQLPESWKDQPHYFHRYGR